MTKLDPLLHRLGRATPLSQADRDALLALPLVIRTLAVRQDLFHERDHVSQCCVVLDGVLCRHKDVQDGQRQILSLHVPGDVPDLHSLHLERMDHSLGALSPARVGFIAHNAMEKLFEVYPNLETAFWRELLVDAAIAREWMLGLGRHDARTRLAHLLCELFLRMKAVGLADDEAMFCPLPITQGDIADVLGLSSVHVNRTLQELRTADLIKLSRGRLTVLDWEGLQAAGEFDPLYLHL